MTIFISYLFYFIAASASPLQRRWLARQRTTEGLGQVSFSFQVAFIVALLSLALPFFSPFQISGNADRLILLGLIAGAFGAAYFISAYIAQKHVEAGIQHAREQYLYSNHNCVGIRVFE